MAYLLLLLQIHEIKMGWALSRDMPAWFWKVAI